MLSVIIPAVASLIATLIFAVIFKGKSKNDQGFTVTYFRLSYRRKMIRTLVNLPLLIGAMVVIFLLSDLTFAGKLSMSLALLVIFLIQVFYNYYMWKKRER